MIDIDAHGKVFIKERAPNPQAAKLAEQVSELRLILGRTEAPAVREKLEAAIAKLEAEIRKLDDGLLTR